MNHRQVSKHVLVFLLCLSLLFGLVSVQAEEGMSGVSDNKPPTISNINIVEKGQTLHVGDTLHVTAQIKDRSDITYASVYFYSEEGGGDISIDLKYNEATSLFEGERKLENSYVNGEYILSSVSTHDKYYNHRAKGGAEFGTFTLEGFSAQTESFWPCELAEKGKTLRPGDTIHISTELDGPVTHASFWIGREVDGYYPRWFAHSLEYNATTKKYEGEYTFSESDANGKYGIVEIGYEINNEYFSKQVDDDTNYVMLTGGSDDETPPVIKSVTFGETGKTLGPGDKLHVKVELEDESAIDYIYVTFAGPYTAFPANDDTWKYEEYRKYHENYGTESTFWIDMRETSPYVWEGECTLPLELANTKYSLDNVDAYDRTGNETYQNYDKNQYWFEFYGPDEEPSGVEEFVTRCYNIILGREPDASGMKTWLTELNSGRKAASEIIDRFVNSNEFKGKGYDNGAAVDILYQAMLGRNADPAGKENWVKKLESGQTLANVINGFCFSKEFKGLCESYGISAGYVNIPDTNPTAEDKIKAFIQRCYRIILDREADPSGMQTWYDQLSTGKKAAAEIIDQFVNSPEFSGKKYSPDESVEILYKAMLGRGSDAAGKANWVMKLDIGQPFAVVINGFCVSKEFTGICESYGIKPGSVRVETVAGMAEEEALSMLALNAKAPITRRSETKPNRVEIINPSDTIDMNIGTAVQAVYINEEKAKEFIGRCYKEILGREAGPAELENWIGQMVNGTKTPDQIARGFLFSNEFKGKNTGNEDLVKILYRVYMNRDADPEGLKTWMEKLDGGTSLKDLLDAFAKTNEFKKVISEMSK